MRFWFFTLLLCAPCAAFCQSANSASATTQHLGEKQKATPSWIPCNRFSLNASANCVVPPQANTLGRDFVGGWQRDGSQFDSKSVLPWLYPNAESLRSPQQFAQMNPNLIIPPLALAPRGKSGSQPIPTQWPNAKVKQIPTAWPNLRFEQIDSRPDVSVMSQSPTK
jgi:hypothetical protein